MAALPTPWPSCLAREKPCSHAPHAWRGADDTTPRRIDEAQAVSRRGKHEANTSVASRDGGAAVIGVARSWTDAALTERLSTIALDVAPCEMTPEPSAEGGACSGGREDATTGPTAMGTTAVWS
eukprot:scaffold90318_cov30-Tisochrysis_lutea.AAC.1